MSINQDGLLSTRIRKIRHATTKNPIKCRKKKVEMKHLIAYNSTVRTCSHLDGGGNVLSIHRLNREIESLRSEMIRVAEHTGSLIDPRVIALSQQLDQLLLVIQRIKRSEQSQTSDSHVVDSKQKAFGERFS